MIPIQNSDSKPIILWDRVIEQRPAPVVPDHHPRRGAIDGRSATLALKDLQRSPAFKNLSLTEQAEVEDDLLVSIEERRDVFSADEIRWMDCNLALVTDEPGNLN